MRDFKVLVPFIKPYKWWIALATICMVIATTMTMVGPWMIRNLIQTVTQGGNNVSNINKINMHTLIVIFVYNLRAVTQFGTNYIAHYVAWNMLKEIRQHIYDHIQKLSLRYFQDKQTGDLMSRVVNDTRNFEQLLAHAIPTIIVNGFMIIGVSAILFSMNVKLAMYTLIPIPLLIWMVLKFSKISRPLFKQAQKRIGEVNSILQDNFSGVR